MVTFNKFQQLCSAKAAPRWYGSVKKRRLVLTFCNIKVCGCYLLVAMDFLTDIGH